MKFEMHKNTVAGCGGVIATFTNGNGVESSTWFQSPPDSIDHVGIKYLQGRFTNVRDVRQERFIKRRFIECMLELGEKEE